MIQSMTAFARVQGEGRWGSAVCEIRSINHRYLELAVRLPETLNMLEASMRERIRHAIHRGKIEFHLRFQPGNAAGVELTVNRHRVGELCKAMAEINQQLANPAPVSPLEILQWPGILQIAEVDMAVIQDAILQLLEQALQELVEARRREGEELKQLFLQRLEAMKAELAKVRHRLPEIYNQQRVRLLARFSDAKVELDSARLEQELVLFAQRIDVAEEIERLDTHISEVRRVLKHGGVVGRRLDFLMQELNREANTLGSKSVDADITHASVELKVLIEQIREQVQNVE